MRLALRPWNITNPTKHAFNILNHKLGLRPSMEDYYSIEVQLLFRNDCARNYLRASKKKKQE